MGASIQYRHYKLEGSYLWRGNTQDTPFLERHFESGSFAYSPGNFFRLQLKDYGTIHPWRPFVGLSCDISDSKLLLLLEAESQSARELFVLLEQPLDSSAQSSVTVYAGILSYIAKKRYDATNSADATLHYVRGELSRGSLFDKLQMMSPGGTMNPNMRLHRHFSKMPTGQ